MNKNILINIFFAAFLVRLITATIYLNYDEHAMTMHQPFLSGQASASDVMEVIGDRDLYNTVAYNIINNGKIGNTEGRPPLYPIFLAISYTIFGYNIFGFFIFQILLASGIAILVFILSERLFNRQVAMISSLIYIFNPHFILLSIQLYSETLYFFLLLMVFHLCRKALADPTPKYINFYIGISLAMAALCRNIFIIFVPFIFLWIAIVFYKNRRRMISSVLVVFITFTLLYTPWAAYSFKNVATPVLMSITETAWKTEKIQDEDNIYFNSEVCYEEVGLFFNWLKKNPKYFLKRFATQFKMFFLMPYVEGVSLRHKITSTFIFIVLYPLGYLGLFISLMQRDKIGYLLSMFIFSMILFHSLHWLTLIDGELRYRQPLELFITIFAAYGMVLLYNAFFDKNQDEFE